MGIKGDMLFCLAMQQTSVVFQSTLELEYCTELGRIQCHQKCSTSKSTFSAVDCPTHALSNADF